MDKRGEIGYELARVHWGKGLINEALVAVINWAFERYDLFKIVATADIRNERSLRVMERLGMRREGLLRSHMIRKADQVIYGLIRESGISEDGGWFIVAIRRT